MKKTAKKLLSMALALVMVLSMLPAVAVPALATETTSSGTGTGTKDAFGISTPDWTAEERPRRRPTCPSAPATAPGRPCMKRTNCSSPWGTTATPA